MSEGSVVEDVGVENEVDDDRYDVCETQQQHDVRWFSADGFSVGGTKKFGLIFSRDVFEDGVAVGVEAFG